MQYKTTDQRLTEGVFITYHIYRPGDRVKTGRYWYERRDYNIGVTNIPVSGFGKYWKRVKDDEAT